MGLAERPVGLGPAKVAGALVVEGDPAVPVEVESFVELNEETVREVEVPAPETPHRLLGDATQRRSGTAL